MLTHIGEGRARRLAIAGLALGAAVCAFVLRRALLQVGGMALEASALCFVAAPLSRVYERHLSRPIAAVAALASIGLIAVAVLVALLPGILRQIVDLARALPHAIRRLSMWMEQGRAWLGARLPGAALPSPDWNGLEGALTSIAGGAMGFVINLADVAGRASMAAVLACFFLADRDRLLLRLELLLPQALRHTAVRMGNEVCRALRLYFGGQFLIAAAVGGMAVLALLALGVRGAVVLGLAIGLLNVIPYFGPYIGGVPAVLIALGDGWQKALMTLAALVLIQQLDGAWLSPRVMGSLTGFSPALVLIGLYAGATLGGIGGMLLALPVMLVGRTLFRVFVQKCENI